MSDLDNPREPGLRGKAARSSPFAREASVFVWLLVGALLVLGLLFFWF